MIFSYSAEAQSCELDMYDVDKGMVEDKEQIPKSNIIQVLLQQPDGDELQDIAILGYN